MVSRLLKLLPGFLIASLSFAQFVPGKYILVLEDPPVASRYSSRIDLERPEAITYRQQIENRQAAIKRDLASRNIAVTGSTSLLSNVIFVNAPSSRVAELRTVSGVVDVRPMRKFTPKLDQATQVLNGPAAWTALGGTTNAGLGIKIGILDSGIDQTHPAFQDASLPMPAGFPKVTTGHPEDAAYTSNKVIVARSYVRLLAAGSNPNNPAVDDEPDDYSPRDRQGHGTAVASCAAAIPVTTPAMTPATGGAVTIQGMAPKAYLGNYKIAGSPGVNEGTTDQVLIQSIEDAVSDGMDIITTSFGSNALTSVANDPVATAWENATKFAVVLAAAGNSGLDTANYFTYPAFNTISSPGNAPDVISVGASENAHVLIPMVTVNGSGAPTSLIGIPAEPSDSAFYPSAQGANTATLVDVTATGDNGLACSALPANSLNGVFVLVEDGTCTDTTKATNAENAGAIGMIIYSTTSTAATIEGVGFNASTDAGFIGPIVSVANAAGLALKSYIDSHSANSVTIYWGATELATSAWSSQYNIAPVVTSSDLAGFSSMGPTPEGLLKPDVVAVGGNDITGLAPDQTDSSLYAPSGIFMATQSYDPQGAEYSTSGYVAADGTSFATPLTAGTAALVKQAYPSLTPGQIKSLIVNNTAQTIATDDYGDPVDAEWIGAGLVNAGAAVAATITAVPSTISFGFLNSATFPITKTITVTNIGKSPVTLSSSVSCCKVNASAGTLTKATLAASPSSLTIAAGASATLTVTLSGSAPPASEYSGAILLQQGSTTVARIPFMMIEGDGVPQNAEVLAGGEGPPGSDLGTQAVQVTDQYGMPVANSPVTFAISPRGGVSLQSVSGEPGCTSSAISVVCNTDQSGVAYAEFIAGPTVQTVTVNVSIAGNATRVPVSINIQNAPKITGIAEAAAGLTTVAPGSYIAIYGTGLSDTNAFNSNTGTFNSTWFNPAPASGAPATEATDPVTPAGAVLPLQIDLVTVSFDVPSAGISVPGHLTYVSPGQVNVQIPWELQGQTSVQVKVTLDGDLPGNVYTLQLANAAPAFFSYSGIAIGANQNGLITTSNPAARGSYITLYANGLGPVANQPASGNPATASPLPQTNTQATVTIGGQPATVAYSGLVPSLPGLYQINVQVPSNISAGTQNITMAIGSATAPTLTLPVQ